MTKKKQAGAVPAPRDPEDTVNLQPARAARVRNDDSEQIERAVYDGMQDLRAKGPGRK